MIVPNLQTRKLAQKGQMSCSCFPFELKAKPGLESRFSDFQLFFYSGLLLFKAVDQYVEQLTRPERNCSPLSHAKYVKR